MNAPTLLDKLTAITVAAMIIILCPGCTPSALRVQAVTASTVAVVANVSLEALGRIYEADLTDSITTAAHGEDTAASAQHRTPCRKCAMDLAEDVVNKRWTPIWGDPESETRFGAWETFRLLHDAWANQIEAGETKSALGTRVNAAYCDLLPLLPAKYRAAIVVAAISCPAPVEVTR